jgi:hypothetical protein
VTAEEFLHRAPTSCLRELRTFDEMLLKRYLRASGISVQASTQYDRLTLLERQQRLPERVLRALHQIRMSGNEAAHGNEGTHERATNQLRNAHAAAAWLVEEIHGARGVAGDFHVPKLGERESSQNEQAEPQREEVEALRRRLFELENRDRPSETSRDRVRQLEARIQELERTDTSSARAAPSPGPMTATASAAWASARSGAKAVKAGGLWAARRLGQGLSRATRFLLRWTRRMLIAGAVATLLFYLPPLYRAGFAPLPESVQTSLPRPETVTQTHADVLSPATREHVEEAVAAAAAHLRDTGTDVVESIRTSATAADNQDAAPSDLPTDE